MATDFNNPSYSRMASATQQFFGTNQMKQIPSPDQPPIFCNYDSTSLMGTDSPTTPSNLSPDSPRASAQSTTNRKEQLYTEVRKSVIEPLLPEVMSKKLEMIDNPLYDFTKPMDKLQSRREQEVFKLPPKEFPPMPDQSFPLSKLQEGDNSKSSTKQQPTSFFGVSPRFRSYTCSKQSEEKAVMNEKTQQRQNFCANLDLQGPIFKKPVKFSRSETGFSKPPVPSKSQVVLDMQNTKGRDYRESSELPQHKKHQSEDGNVNRATVL